MNTAPLIVRVMKQSDTCYNMFCGALCAFEEFGKEVFFRQFHIATDFPGFPDLCRRITNGVLDIVGYHCDLQDFYEANPGRDIFSLEIVTVPLRAEKGRVFASSWKHIDLRTGKLKTPNKYSAVISTIPLFQEQEAECYTQARAYLLGWHELGHIAKDFAAGEESHCPDKSCIMSREDTPKERQRALEQKVSATAFTKKAPLCENCEKAIKDFSKIYFPSQ